MRKYFASDVFVNEEFVNEEFAISRCGPSLLQLVDQYRSPHAILGIDPGSVSMSAAMNRLHGFLLRGFLLHAFLLRGLLLKSQRENALRRTLVAHGPIVDEQKSLRCGPFRRPTENVSRRDHQAKHRQMPRQPETPSQRSAWSMAQTESAVVAGRTQINFAGSIPTAAAAGG